MPNESITPLIDILQTQGVWAFIAALVRTLLSVFDGQHWFKKMVAATCTFFIGMMGAAVAGSVESLKEYETAITILFTIFGYDLLKWVLKDPKAAFALVSKYLPWSRNE